LVYFYLEIKTISERDGLYQWCFGELIYVNHKNLNVMNDNSKVLVGLLAGLAAGAALGLLFAPEKGSETRDRLSQSLKDLGDAIRDRAEDEINNLGNLKDKVVTSVKSKLRQSEEEFVDDDLEHA
jgi:gas vesicle protein